MSYSALMVHLDVERSSDRRVALAGELADRFHAALIGIAGWSFLPSFLADGPEAAADNGERQQMTALFDKMERTFRAATKRVKHVEWRGLLDYATDLVPREARAADLVVVGRDQVPSDLFFSLNPGVAILRTGRPVLVVPNEVDSLQARRVVVAWKDTREARRAIRDALPFLMVAKEVMIVAVCEQGAETAVRQEIDDVANYLVRHKVFVAAKVYLHTKDSVASELLRFTKNEKADLIVVGGYGHSRLGEWMFGGVTRDLLSRSPVCCLFSH